MEPLLRDFQAAAPRDRHRLCRSEHVELYDSVVKPIGYRPIWRSARPWICRRSWSTMAGRSRTSRRRPCVSRIGRTGATRPTATRWSRRSSSMTAGGSAEARLRVRGPICFACCRASPIASVAVSRPTTSPRSGVGYLFATQELRSSRASSGV